jgi:hypothetical protein
MFTGPATQRRHDVWKQFSESKTYQESLLRGAEAARTFALVGNRGGYVPQSVWDKLEVATGHDLNRSIVRDLSKLIILTMNEQDTWPLEEKCESLQGSEPDSTTR